MLQSEEILKLNERITYIESNQQNMENLDAEKYRQLECALQMKE